MIGARVLAVGLLALGVGGCGAGAVRPAHRPAARVAATRDCAQPERLSSGTVIAGWRMGAVAFSSAEDGVGATAATVWCNVPLGRGGSEPTEVHQTVLLAVTHDGGTQWRTVGVPAPRAWGGATEHLIGASAHRVWLLTASGRVLATTDAGASWSALPAPPWAVQMTLSRGQLWVLACPPLPGGVARCRLALARLDVAGGRWTHVALPRREAIANPQVAVFGHSVLLYTADDAEPPTPLAVSADDGRRWNDVALPRWKGRPCPTPSDFAAASPRTWWFLCIGGAAAGSSEKALFRTTNGGRTWRIMSQVASLTGPERPGQIPRMEPGQLVPASPTRLWLALTNGLAVTADGGAVWRSPPLREVNPQGYMTYLDVLSDSHAWLLAPGEGLWRTTDGARWRALSQLKLG